MLKKYINNDFKITVVDSIMGSGKTSWAIKYIDELPEVIKVIFATPFLSEVDRVIKNVNSRKFYEPNEKNDKGTKLNGFKELLKKGANIATTHSLLRLIDDEMIALIKRENYILIQDECMEVMERVEFDKFDLQLMINSSFISIEDKNCLKWIGPSEYKGRFKEIKDSCINGGLYRYGESSILISFLRRDIFDAFGTVFILTYMFDGQYQKYYFDFFEIEYQLKSVSRVGGEYRLSSYYEQGGQKFNKLINVYNGDLNKIGDGKCSLSSTKLKAMNKDEAKIIKNSIYNYFHNITKSKSNGNMWTTVKAAETKLKGTGYSKGFVACNSRATNEFSEKRNLAYILNRFINPIEKNFFNDNGIEFDEDKFALAEMLQWIFRSAIRKGEEINIYIPSKRMRKLLEGWLNDIEYTIVLEEMDELEAAIELQDVL